MNILFSHIRLNYENRTATLLLRDGRAEPWPLFKNARLFSVASDLPDDPKMYTLFPKYTPSQM